MAFWSRLSQAETWPEMESAAGQRFWDACELATTNDRCRTGALYLFGYVVEMLLKTAYYRVQGVPRHADTSAQRNLARALARGYARRNDHDLNYWVFVLERARSALNRPLDPALLGAIHLRVATVASNWSESVRYRDAQPTGAELHEVFHNVEWILEHREQLWR